MYGKHGLTSPSGRYTAFDRPLMWTQARSYCSSLGMNLATIANSLDNEEVAKLTTRTCGHVMSRIAGWDLCAWIGLNDFKTEGTLVWSSGSTSQYRNFVKGEPNNMGDEDGMALCWTFQGRWIDYQNEGSLPCFVCQKK